MSRRNPFALLYAVMTLSYIVIVAVIVSAFTRSAATPARILLNDYPMYLKKGFEPADAVFQDFSPDQWVKLPGKAWGIKKSGLARPLPFLWPGKQESERFTYALKFTVDPEQLAYIRANGTTPALYIPAIAENWEIFLNARSISRALLLDAQDRPVKPQGRRLLIIPFDPSLLAGGENALVVHVLTPPWYNDAGLFFSDDHYIDDHERIQAEHSSVMFYMFAGIYFFMAFYDFLMYLGGRKETYRIFFSLEMLILAVYMFLDTPFRFLIFADSALSLKLELTAISLSAIPVLFFVHSLCGKKPGPLVKALLAASGGVTLLMAFAEQQFLLDLLTLSELFISASLASCYVVLLRAVGDIAREYRKTRGKGRAFIAAVFDSPQGNTFLGFNVVLLSVIVAIMQSLGLLTTRGDSSVALIGLFAFSTSVSFAFAIDFSKTKRQAESHNVILEETVRERTLELKEQSARAVAANEAKSKFLATMSHEIRTPMNAILGLSEMTLRLAGLPETVYVNVEKIRGSGSGLLAIINDILDLSKIESGKLSIDPEEYVLPDLISDVVQINLVRIGSKSIAFTLELDPGLPRRLRGDELRVKQILNNILSNAFKYTEKGFVRMAVSQEKTKAGFFLIFTVADSGQGMQEEDVKTLFDEYSRFNTGANRATEGTGLGMSITQKLVALMDGAIEVASEYGAGSTFTVRLPQETIGGGIIGGELAENLKNFKAVPRRSEGPDLPQEYMPYGKVLVVDDLETNLYVASGLMAPYGLTIETADSGEEVLEKIRSGRTYDIIFMDHMMPGMDGVEATTRLRALGYGGTIIALTANAISGQAERFLRNGFDGFISKPIDTRQLDAALRQWIRDKHPHEARQGGRSPPGFSPRGGGPAPGRPPPGAFRPEEQSVPPKGPSLPPIPGLDLARGIAATGGTAGGYRKVLAAFRKDAEERLGQLRTVPEREGLPFFTTQVHALKSAAASIGAAEVSSGAARLEAAGRAGDLALIAQVLPGFTGGLEDVLDGIRAALAEEAGPPPGPPRGGEAAPDPARLLPLLEELARALREGKTAEIDRLLEEAARHPLDPGGRERLEEISGEVLMAEFDAAREILGALLDRLRGLEYRGERR